MKKQRRSYQRIITPTSKILRFMRMSRRISMRAAGAEIGISYSAIAHYEQGRMEIRPDRVRHLVASYGYTMQEFGEYAGGKPLPTLSIKDECFCLIERLDETKLRAVHALLVGFVS